MEQPSSSSCTVRVAKMPAAFLRPPSARDELSAAATQFGGADKVAVLHSKRCALLELPSAEAAAAMVAHHAAQPLVLGGKPAVVSVEAKGRWKWSTWEQSRQLSLTDDERVAKECAACVALLVARGERVRFCACAPPRARPELCPALSKTEGWSLAWRCCSARSRRPMLC